MSTSVRVKHLVWDEHNRADIYSVKEYFGQGPTDYFLSRGTRIVGNFNTVAEAKTAAQADHEARILGAIEGVGDWRDGIEEKHWKGLVDYVQLASQGFSTFWLDRIAKMRAAP